MRRCNSRPYEGKEKYIFVSYCHKDKDVVFPIIESLSKEGYRIWYDEGIDPGTEWPEIIASHLNSCEVCMIFVSNNSNNSHNCRREITFALLKKKKCLSVYIEQVQLSVGMEMQLSSIQAIFKYSYEKYSQFLDVLLKTSITQPCLGSPNPEVVVSNELEIHDEKSDSKNGNKSFSDKWLVNKDNIQKKEEDYCKQESLNKKLFLIRENTKERIEVNRKRFSIGRSSDSCDYCILNNRSVSRIHAIIVFEKNNYYITDNNSANKTYVDSKQIEPNHPINLYNSKVIKIADETFIVELINNKICKYYIKRIKTDERIEISKKIFRIGKKQDICDYVIKDNLAVSRHHLDIILNDNKCYIRDHNSTNRTFINGVAIKPDCDVKVENSDEIRLGDEAFILETE